MVHPITTRAVRHIAVLCLGLAAAGARAEVLVYDSETFFNLDYPGLTIEDFEEAPDGAPTDCATLLNSVTNDDCFQPGDLPPGVDIVTTSGGVLIAASPGFQGLPGNMVAPNIGIHILRLEFSPAVRAVGFDQYTFPFGSPDPQFITAFRAGDQEIATVKNVVTNSGVFFAIESDQPITALEIHSPANSPEFIDNLRFQAATTNDNFIFYPDETSFDQRYPDLPVEDFEAAKAADNSALTCSTLLRHASDDDCFDFARLMAGFELRTVNDNALVAFGIGYLGVSSRAVAPDIGTDRLRLEFPQPVSTLGLNQLTVASGSPDTPNLRVFDTDGNEILNTDTAASTAGEFLGFRSRLPIGAVEIHSVANHPEFVDDIRFRFASEDDCFLVMPRRTRPLPVCF